MPTTPPKNALQWFREVQTPAILYDLPGMSSLPLAVRDTFSRFLRGAIAFSIKADRNEEILQMLASNGFAASISSIEKMQRCLRVGFQKIFATAAAFSLEEMQILGKNGIYPGLNSLPQLEIYGGHFSGSPVGLHLRLYLPEALKSPWARGNYTFYPRASLTRRILSSVNRSPDK